MPMLKAAPGLRPIAVFEELCRRHADLALARDEPSTPRPGWRRERRGRR